MCVLICVQYVINDQLRLEIELDVAIITVIAIIQKIIDRTPKRMSNVIATWQYRMQSIRTRTPLNLLCLLVREDYFDFIG